MSLFGGGGGGNAGTVEVDVEGDFSKFRQGMDKQGRKAGSAFGTSFGGAFGSTFAKIGSAYAVSNFVKNVITQSSDLAEAVNVTGLAFGDFRGEIDETAKKAADMFGLTESAYRGLSAQIGNIFVQSGAAQKDAATLTNAIIGRATDMGSAWNASTQEVSEAINSGLIGQFEPLRKYGVILDKAAVVQRAMADNIGLTREEITPLMEQQATAALIMEQTNNVAGDFKNTQDGVANSAKTVTAMWGDMQAQLGQGLLPVLSIGLKLLRQLGPEGMKIVLMGTAVAVVFVKITQGAHALGGALKLLSANPWVLAAMAIIAVGVLIWKNWDTVKEKGAALVNFVTGIPSAVSSAFTGLAGMVSAPFIAAFNAIKTAWNATVGGFGFKTPSWIPLLGGKSFTIPSMAGGGVASSPMLAQIGDAGVNNPEVVSPVSLMRDTMLEALLASNAGDRGGVSVSVSIAVNGNEFADPRQLERHGRQLARIIGRELDRDKKAAGQPVGIGR